jgi:hypothetical protein
MSAGGSIPPQRDDKLINLARVISEQQEAAAESAEQDKPSKKS